MKNILYIYHNADAYGGGDASLLALLGKLDREIFNPYVLCTAKSLFTERLQDLEIEYMVIDRDYLNNLGRLRFALLLLRLCLFIKRKKIKLIHVNSLGKLHYLAVPAKYLGIKTIYHLRSLLVTREIRGKWKNVVNDSDKIIAHCEHMKKTAIEQGLDKDKICRIFNGAILDEFNPTVSGEKVRKEFGINNGAAIIGMVARVVPWKGCDDFIKAAGTISKTFPDTKFIIVGETPDGKYYDQLLKLAENIGIKDK